MFLAVWAVISIHALLAESDAGSVKGISSSTAFLSTLSLRRATVEEVSGDTWARDFYPRSPCGERPGCQRPCERPTRDFYPRSPCGERRYSSDRVGIFGNISIHALLAESDSRTLKCLKLSQKFLSTLSLRRATLWSSKTGRRFLYFYPRSPCGERQYPPCPYSQAASYFYPRSPCGERPDILPTVYSVSTISIHALLAESDMLIACHNGQLSDFYPRSPCGERHPAPVN